MKNKIIAVIMILSITCIVGGLSSEQLLGSAVDDVDSSAIRGGTCQNELSSTCQTKGTCTGTSVLSYTGNGDFQQDTKINCGGFSSCVSWSNKSKKCGE